MSNADGLTRLPAKPRVSGALGMASCPNCGSSIQQGDAFCGSCGAKTAAAPPLRQREPAPSPAPPQSSVPQPGLAGSQPTYVAPALPKPGAIVRLSRTGWILCGSAAAIVLASLLSWSQASALGITISSSPRSGAPVFVMVLAAIALGFGWPSTRGELSKRRVLGLAAVAGVLSIFVVTNWSDLSRLQSADPEAQISAGAGLYLYTAGVVAMWVCVVRASLARRPR